MRAYDLHDSQLCKKVTPKVAQTSAGLAEYLDLGEGPIVVALHGAMGGYDQSLILAQTIGDSDHRYLCVSRPGYLGTPLAGNGSPERQADLIAALLDTLGVGHVGVMAVSGGGPAALHFALQHAARCDGLVLVSTCATHVDTKIPARFKVMTWLASWPWFANRLRRNAERNLEAVARRSIRDPELLLRTMQDGKAWPLFRALLLSTFDRMDQRLIGTKNDIEASRAMACPLENVKVPALIIHGTDDSRVPFEVHAKAFEQRLPSVELMAVEGGEHVAIFTHRELVRPKVKEFMHAHFAPR